MELDKEIIVQLNKFLKDHKSSVVGKGLYEALFWLHKFINYFEEDYTLWLEESNEIKEESGNNLSDEDKFIMEEQRLFLNKMFKE